ncbi:SapC family protein [Microbulbifer sp. 2201CG32-9]|uniref:SapC family protein n=1 Tax=unclassified Microbulbifer TaxID=2619833 RepID=UPI00345C1B39
MTDNEAPKIVPLSKEAHHKLKVRELGGFDHVKKAHMVPVTAHEMTRLGAEYPIVFVKNSESEQYQAVALLGLKVGENLFLDADGNWQGVFLPASIRNHPFLLAPSGKEEGQLMVGIIENSPLVNEEEGNPLFTEEGSESEYLKAKKESLVGYLESDQMTRAFVQVLVEKDLLMEQTVTVTAGAEKINLNGLHMVNEKKLNELSADDFADFHKRGFLPPLYCQLSSMHQLTRLAKMHATNNA